MTILAIKPRNEELDVYLGTDDVWAASSRLTDGTHVVACGASPEDALSQLRRGCGPNLAPYSVLEYQEAVRIAMAERGNIPHYTTFAVLLERTLGRVKPEERPFGYWERWISLALHALETANFPTIQEAGCGFPASVSKR